MKKKILMVTGAAVLVTSALALFKVKKNMSFLEEESFEIETEDLEEVSIEN